jgi:hypothetical protein
MSLPASIHASPDRPEIEPSPSLPSPPSPQTDYLAMNQDELSEQNIVETTSTRQPARPHDQSLFAELLDFVKHRNWKKKLLTAAIMGSSVCVFVDLIFFGNIQSILIRFLEWMALHTTLAVFAFIAIFVISTRKYRWSCRSSCVYMIRGIMASWLVPSFCSHHARISLCWCWCWCLRWWSSHFHPASLFDFWGRICVCANV